MLIFNRIDLTINKTDILEDISFSFEKGSILGVVGENGAGKTSLLNLVSKIYEPTSGYVLLDGKAISKISNEDYYRFIGALIGEASVYPHLTVYENLYNQAIVFDLSKNRVEEVLEIIGLKEYRNSLGKNISRGMKQRLGLGFAFLHQPKFIILDEPMNGLDQSGLTSFISLIKELNANNGISFIIASHSYDALDNMISDLLILKRGKVFKHCRFDSTTDSVKLIYNECNESLP